MKYQLYNLKNFFIDNNNINIWNNNIIEPQKIGHKIGHKIGQKIGHKKEQNNEQNNETKENITIFLEKDSLFWCFFYLLHGEFEYSISNSSYAIEQEQKIKLIQKVRDNKQLLKTIKIKSNYIEDQLVNTTHIDMITFYSLCFIHNIDFILQDNHFYWENLENNTDLNVIKIIDKKIHLFDSETSVNSIRTKSVKSQLKSKIKTFSNYKVPELVEICIKLKINIIDENQKKKIKKQLYNEILEYI